MAHFFVRNNTVSRLVQKAVAELVLFIHGPVVINIHDGSKLFERDVAVTIIIG